MPKSILVTGASGQLGSEISSLAKEYSQYKFLLTDRSTLDITDDDAIENFLQDKDIDYIINCAAYTAVDKAESDKESAHKVNVTATENLAKIAKKKNISLVHVSTDYVFNGQACRPYIESDPVAPQGVYGQTKLEGEQALQAINPKNSIIIRTSWVYSSFGNNFVKTMQRLGTEREQLNVIFDQVGSPTYAKDLAYTILEILPKINNTTVEVYNFSNEGACSWYDFALEIFDLSEIACKVLPIETKDYPTPAKRPHYSLLNKAKIKSEYKIDIPHWKESLKSCLLTLKEKK